MTYEEAINYIKDKGKFGSKPGLTVISDLLHRMGDPQNCFPAVHIAGTNGKGSTSSYIRNVLDESGYRTGLFTSPPIIDETERIQICGEYISKEEFTEITEYVRPFADAVETDGLHYPTEFELYTAIAFEYFARKQIDIAIIEVGMGGRLDSTNVCNTAVSVIVNIGLDHTQWLGDTLAKIAGEKAGIIKKNTPVVLYPDEAEEVRDTVRAYAARLNAPFYDSKCAEITVLESSITGNRFDYKDNDIEIKGIRTRLVGEHQIKNAVTAIKTLTVLAGNGFDISHESIKKGISNTSWPGRFEVVSKAPLVIFDGGHNVQCMQALTDCVDRYLQDREKILVFSMFADKDCRNSIELLKGRFDHRIICEMKHPRRAEKEFIASLFEEETQIVADPKEAVEYARRMAEEIDSKGGKKAAVVVCGSLNLLEEILAR